MNDKLNKSDNDEDDSLGNSDGQEEAPLNIAKVKSRQGYKDENRQGKLSNKNIESSGFLWAENFIEPSQPTKLDCQEYLEEGWEQVWQGTGRVRLK